MHSHSVAWNANHLHYSVLTRTLLEHIFFSHFRDKSLVNYIIQWPSIYFFLFLFSLCRSISKCDFPYILKNINKLTFQSHERPEINQAACILKLFVIKNKSLPCILVFNYSNIKVLLSIRKYKAFKYHKV